MKRAICLLLTLILLAAWTPALAGLSRFDKAPAKTRIYAAKTEKSITLLYGDKRYTAGSLGMIYADRSEEKDRELPLLVLFFTHNGSAKNKTMTVVADKKKYVVTRDSDLNKTGIAESANAFHLAVGPSTIAMLQDMVRAKSVKITCGPAKDIFEIVLTEEKKALIKLAVEEYTGHIKKVYDKLDRLEYIKYVSRPAADITVSAVKAAAAPQYQTLTLRSTGAAVRKLQRYLIHYKYLTGTADGKYTKKVADAVKKYQKRLGLSQTGKADAALQKRLFAKEIPWKPAVSLANASIKMIRGQRTFCPAFKNTDCEYTVTGISLLMRVLDANGRALTVNGSQTFLHSITKITLRPNSTRNNAKDRAGMAAFPQGRIIEAGVCRYTLSDGTAVNIPAEEIKWVRIK